MKFAVLVTLGFAAQSFACSSMPVEMRTDFFNDAAARVLTEAHVKLSDIHIHVTEFKNTVAVKYEWIKTDPAFMCHDKETLKTDVSFEYEKDHGKTACVLKATLTKTEAFYTGAPKTEYKIENLTNECE